MNKQERKLKGLNKFKKRLKNYGYKIEDVFKQGYNLFCFKTTGKPCSCFICRGEKFNRIEKHKNNINE
jgi:hypothetical protein